MLFSGSVNILVAAVTITF